VKKIVRVWLALMIAAACVLPAAAEGGSGWALVIGIDRYDSSDIAPLNCPRSDARAVAQALIERCGFARDHVILMTSDASDPREKPTSTNILRWLYGLRRSVKPGDDFVFYFSGHGITQGDESYLLTSETTIGGEALLRRSSLGVAEIREAMKGLHAARVLELIDACRNDPRASKGVADSHMDRGFSRDLVLKAKSTLPYVDCAAAIFACRVGQRSYENCEGHGYFTYFLLEGLYGEAGDASGHVTLSSLLAWLERKVPEAVRLREPGRVQEPWADLSGTGALDWVLALSRVPAADPSQPAVVLGVSANGMTTPAATCLLPARIGGGPPQRVTVSVNGRPVPLPPSALTLTADGATMRLDVPLEIGENTVLVAAVGPDGLPVQASVIVVRDPRAPAPLAGRPLPAVPEQGRVTAQAAADYYRGDLYRRKQSDYDRDREKWGRDEADMMRPSTSTDGDR
jgi:hypothetical protein